MIGLCKYFFGEKIWGVIWARWYTDDRDKTDLDIINGWLAAHLVCFHQHVFRDSVVGHASLEHQQRLKKIFRYINIVD